MSDCILIQTLQAMQQSQYAEGARSALCEHYQGVVAAPAGVQEDHPERSEGAQNELYCQSAGSYHTLFYTPVIKMLLDYFKSYCCYSVLHSLTPICVVQDDNTL